MNATLILIILVLGIVIEDLEEDLEWEIREEAHFDLWLSTHDWN